MKINKQKLLTLLILLFVTLFFINCFANNKTKSNYLGSVGKSSKKLSSKKNMKEKKFYNTFEINTYSTLSEHQNKEILGNYSLSTRWQPNKIFFSQVSLQYSYQYQHVSPEGRKGYWNSIYWEIGSDKNFKNNLENNVVDSRTIKLKGLIPLGYKDQLDSFITSIGTSISISKRFKKFIFIPSIGYNYSFFRYDQARDGSYNNPHTFQVASSGIFSLTDKWKLNVFISFSHVINYMNNRNNFNSSGISTSYMLAKNMQMDLGLQTKRNTLLNNGSTEMIHLYDQNAAIGYFNFKYLF